MCSWQWRFGGWLNQSTIDESVKFPLLITKGSICARLIMRSLLILGEDELDELILDSKL